MVDIALNKAARGFDELAVVVKQGRRVAEEHFRWPVSGISKYERARRRFFCEL